MPPTGNAVQVEATLEDAFLLYFGEKAGDKDDVQYELKKSFFQRG